MTNPKTFTITRTFNAPRGLMWQAWTAPDWLTQWFGPKGSTCEIKKLDLRVGGIVHSRILFNNVVIWGKFTYQEIVPESRLSWLHSFSDEKGNITRHPFNPHWPLELITTVSFTGEGAGTKVTLTWVPVNASPVEEESFEKELSGASQGWAGSFDNLEKFLRAAQAA